jgi:hypothetical protein
MPALVAGIHVFSTSEQKDVDGRDKPGHHGARDFVNTLLAIVARSP